MSGTSSVTTSTALAAVGMALSDDEMRRYHRQINLKGWDLSGQERLKAARVLIIGVGGLGCAASQYLAAAGVGQLTLLDGDKVETSNLARQILHEPAAVGQFKVDSAAHRLQALNADCQVIPLPWFADELNLPDLLVDADLVLDCSDNRATRDLVNLCCRAAQVPLISGAAIRFEGQVMLFDWQPGTPCYRCFSRLFDEPEGSCVTNGVAGPLVGVVGSLQALEAVKWLTGSAIQHGGELLLVDGRSLTFDKMALRRDPCCPVCARSDEKRSGEAATSQLIC